MDIDEEIVEENASEVDGAPPADDSGEDLTPVEPAPAKESTNLVAEAADPLLAAKKVRVAIVFAYTGTNYQGLQKNPGAKSIEEALERAIYGAGCVPRSWQGDLHMIEWNRAARTDKGVHAAGNVVSLRLVMPAGGETELREKIAQHLPDDICCVDVIRTISNFNAKNQCSARQYEYLLPTFILEPVKAPQYIAKAPPLSESMKKLLGERPQVMPTDVDEYTTGEAFSRGSAEARPRYRTSETASSLFDVTSHTAEDGAAAILSAYVPSEPDAYQTGVAFDAGRTEAWTLCKSREAASRRGFRLPPHLHDKLRKTFEMYMGTSAFHNFTPRMTFGDASTSRYISDARVSAPFVVGEGESALEYVKFTLVGQSFLYNQIRHMVGLAVDVVRGAAPAHMMDVAFGHGVVRLPLAPAEGLYLAHCNFTGYDRRHTVEGFKPLTYLSAEANARMEAFRDNFIWKEVHASVLRDKPFEKYLEEAADVKYRVQVPAQLAQVLARNPSARAATEAVGEKRGRDETTAAAEEEEDVADGSAAKRFRDDDGAPRAVATQQPLLSFEQTINLVLTRANPKFFTGLSFSKTAKEKTEFKQKMRQHSAAFEGDEEASEGPKKGNRGAGRRKYNRNRGHWWRDMK